METIVVGVDGSETADAALEFAVAEAALRGATLRIVSAWDIPAAAYGGGYLDLDEGIVLAIRDEAQKVADAAAATAAGSQPSLRCDVRVIEGQAAAALLDQAADASLLVVGNRGRGGFASLLLGSVSQQVVQHATCPVVIVRAR
jgi:nucleotide-binding universal stress UspA family protein